MTSERIDKEFLALIALLRLAVNPAAEQPQQQPVLIADEWREVYHLAVKHAVVALAWDGVERLQSQTPDALRAFPADLMGKWFADVQAIEAANSQMAMQASYLHFFMQEGDFDAYTLKGVTWAAYYPKPEHRQSADIDLWVLPNKNKLASLQERREALIAFLNSREVPIGEVVYHHLEAKFFRNTEVELHVTPTWLYNPLHNNRLQQQFLHARFLTHELQETYALLHAFRHIYHDGLALRHMLDYFVICRANREKDIAAPSKFYRQIGMNSFARAMDELSEYLFASPATSSIHLSRCARHLLDALPLRHISKRVQWDYPSETIWRFPWRTAHFFWRKTLSK